MQLSKLLFTFAFLLSISAGASAQTANQSTGQYVDRNWVHVSGENSNTFEYREADGTVRYSQRYYYTDDGRRLVSITGDPTGIEDQVQVISFAVDAQLPRGYPEGSAPSTWQTRIGEDAAGRIIRSAENCVGYGGRNASNSSRCIEQAGRRGASYAIGAELQRQARDYERAGDYETAAALYGARIAVAEAIRTGDFERALERGGAAAIRDYAPQIQSACESNVGQGIANAGVGAGQDYGRSIGRMCRGVANTLDDLLFGDPDRALQRLQDLAIDELLNIGAQGLEGIIAGLFGGGEQEGPLGLDDIFGGGGIFGGGNPGIQRGPDASTVALEQYLREQLGAASDPAARAAIADAIGRATGNIPGQNPPPALSQASSEEAVTATRDPAEDIPAHMRYLWPNSPQARVAAAYEMTEDQFKTYTENILASPRATFRLSGQFTAPAIAALFESEEQFAQQEVQTALLRDNTIKTAAAAGDTRAQAVDAALDACIFNYLSSTGRDRLDPYAYAEGYMKCVAADVPYAPETQSPSLAMNSLAAVLSGTAVMMPSYVSLQQAARGFGELQEIFAAGGPGGTPITATPAIAFCPGGITDPGTPTGAVTATDGEGNPVPTPPSVADVSRGGLKERIHGYLRGVVRTYGAYLERLQNMSGFPRPNDMNNVVVAFTNATPASSADGGFAIPQSLANQCTAGANIRHRFDGFTNYIAARIQAEGIELPASFDIGDYSSADEIIELCSNQTFENSVVCAALGLDIAFKSEPQPIVNSDDSADIAERNANAAYNLAFAQMACSLNNSQSDIVSPERLYYLGAAVDPEDIGPRRPQSNFSLETLINRIDAELEAVAEEAAANVVAAQEMRLRQAVQSARDQNNAPLANRLEACADGLAQ